MERVAALLSRHFGVRDGVLVMDGVPVDRLAAAHGTPLYAYSAGALDRQWARLRETLPSRFSVHYSVKANPNPTIVRHFVERGCGLEVASAGELEVALNAGCAPERVLFAGPGKTERELELAVERRVGEVHLESFREAERLGAIARRHRRRVPVAIRVNPAGDAEGGAMRMGGRPAPFGLDEELLEKALDHVDGDRALDLRGLHLFAGTQILDQSVLVRQYRKGIELARRAAMHLGRPLATLDFGGGLGIPYFPGERSLDMEALGPELEGLMAEVEADPLLAGTHLVVEPGRFLAGEAGLYVAGVTDVKRSRGKTFVVLDGGMNHHLAASGNLGQVIKRNFPVAVVNRLDRAIADTVDVVGPLCTPLDTLAREVTLPEVQVGDLIAFFQSGAYGLTASPLHFLGHPSPAEVLVRDGEAHAIRPRGALA